jgi:hypothetical protein
MAAETVAVAALEGLPGLRGRSQQLQLLQGGR